VTGTQRTAPEAAPPCGRLRGAWEGEAAVFRGIPYAASPVGDLRFAAPRPHPGWDERRDATTSGPAAPQGRPILEPLFGTVTFPQAEDECLTLDVFTPGTDAAGDGRPVLVWIHGGGFSTGYGSGPRQSGAGLAARAGLVVVTVNYRLGPLGYLYLAGLADGFGAGNFGLLDQIAALRWVRGNIAAFGGDPANVTLAGHSSGALSAAAAAVSPEAASLVRRAILLSPQLADVATAEAATAAAAELLDVLGLERGRLDELRRLPADQLVKAADALAARKGPAGATPALVAGGSALPRPVIDAFADAPLPGPDLLISTVRDEARGFLFADPSMRAVQRPQVIGLLGRFAGDRAAAVYDHYAARRPGGVPCDIAADALTDLLFRMPVVRLCQIRARAGLPAFAAEFDWEAPADGFGACHGVDLPFLLGERAAWADAPFLAGSAWDRVRVLAGPYQDMLAAFARTGRPTGPGPAAWLPYTLPDRATMRFGALVGPVNDAAGPERRLWSA
jgi:para-nitrobenzyl esterase